MLKTLQQHSDAVTCLVFSPNGKTLVSGSNDGKIMEWKINDKESQTFPEQHRRGVTSIAISPDGETLISGGRDQTIKIWKR
jgi:WD40 repeat protein